MAAPSFSKSKVVGIVVLVAGVTAACQAPAPALPRDTTGTNATHPLSADEFSQADLALSCDQILAERNRLRDQIDRAKANINANRESNVAASAVGAMVFAPAYILTEGNYTDKDALKAGYARLDIVDKLAVFRHC
jgi:hypothetical protein